MNYSADIKKLPRQFLPADFTITNWESLHPFLINLDEREINSSSDLKQWLKDASELEAVISEDACWRQIKMTCDTENKELEESFNYFMMEIQPKVQPYSDKLNKKLVENPFTKELDADNYFTYLRNVKKNIELFREVNIPINAELNVMQQQFGTISGKMTVEVNGQEYTLQQAAKFLEDEDRSVREEVYHKINKRRLEDKEALNKLFTTLLQKRHQVAVNTDFENYRDFRFKELGRFDYSKEDCFQFHEAVKLHVMPLVNQIYEAKKKKLGLDTLRPWDVEAEPAGIQPLRPFKTGEELTEKTIACFDELSTGPDGKSFFGDCLRKMKELGHLDLESRKGKAPGGYNCPLAESGAPFIFMNAAGQLDDVTTMVHEGGHAIHSFLAHELELTGFKEYPTEIAEVASMAMELFSMDKWNVFFDSPEELKRAKEQQLERVITIFPWIATIDKFQHWIYENPNHTEEERSAQWMIIAEEFSSPLIDFSGLEEYRRYGWQRQLHLYEVPFYYIEYGIAQLGAIGLWQQYKQDPEKAMNNYITALQLGGTKTLPELFKAAGLQFDLSPEHIKQLMKFVKSELESL
ncbi:MAG: M3 family oligoendopeptidase [Chitinophagaceae bacterium]|nr:M3 family oligoendopeptidase [Chitinophagaceae bacterium]MBK8309673.1 M3 family oligoendopeptidase [Chitinophagaceae bacterium]MBP6476273.1 M3 family oligoendopeptidase [Chitinophagaceae bacterium]MBP7108070.1 M3 family oligoendopeptidase [Chitinophagaceae bacterium]MBP7313644.1 M3 family oligoendopeptidase [Chitinophagaceae bacterium]